MVRVITQILKIVTICVTAVLVATGGFRAFDYALNRTTPEDIGQRVEITVGEDETDEQIAEKLADAGLIRSKLLFTGQMKVTGVVPEPGTYNLRKGMTVPQIISRVSGEAPDEDVDGDGGDIAVGAGESFEITIPEGWRVEQVAQAFADESGMENGYDAFMEATADVDRSRYDFLATLPDDASLEGFLFPDTYNFVADDPAYNIALMLDNFDAKYTPDMRDRTEAMGIDVRTVLTLASLVEREAKLPAERPVIADIYIKRWTEGWNLEADPTIQYVVGEPGDTESWWPELSEEELHLDNPYNTYQNAGLPPGPICNPGIGSIQAVLFPEETPYYFFVATGDESGTHAFAATKAEHDANVDAYRDAIQSGEGG